MEKDTTVQKLVYRQTKDLCPFIAYCAFEFETVYQGLILSQELVTHP